MTTAYINHAACSRQQTGKHGTGSPQRQHAIDLDEGLEKLLASGGIDLVVNVGTSGSLGPAWPAGGGVPVHPGAAAGAQDRPDRPAVDGEVDGPSDRRRERDEDDLGALADDAQDAVAVLLPEIGDVGSAGFEHA